MVGTWNHPSLICILERKLTIMQTRIHVLDPPFDPSFLKEADDSEHDEAVGVFDATGARCSQL